MHKFTRFLLLSLVSLILFNCERALILEDTPEQLILTLQIQDDFLGDDDRGFFYLNGIDGTLLDAAEFFNNTSNEISIPYAADRFALTYLISSPNIPGVTANSYLDLSVGQSITLSRRVKVYSNSANLAFDNLPIDFDEIVLAKSNYYSPIGPGTLSNGQRISWGYDEDQPLAVVTALTQNQPLSFQSLSLSDSVLIDVNLNKPMTQLHNLGVFEPNAAYTITMSGLTDQASTYRLYQTTINANGSGLTLLTPDIFDMFTVNIGLIENDALYEQWTRTDIPERVDKFDPIIQINSNSFESFNFEVSLESTFAKALWQTSDNSLTWSIYTSKDLNNNYFVYQIPASVSALYPQLNSIGDLKLQHILAAKISEMNYDQVIQDLVEGNIRDYEHILSKTMLIE